MKFFNLIPLSNYLFVNLVYLDDAPSILEPSRLLYFLYSTLRNQLPKNVFPNISFPILKILVVTSAMFYLLIFLLSRSCLLTANTLPAYARDFYLQLLSKSQRSQNCIFGQANHGTLSEHRLSIHDNDIWSPIRYERSFCLQYANFFNNLPYCKYNNFIETKVAAIKLRGFNHF